MKAITIKEFGSAAQLIQSEVPLPVVQDDEVLVPVKAISINPVDVKARSGKALAEKLKAFDPIILGWDISGVVTETGSKVTAFKAGDEVFGMVNFPGHGKAYAEYVAAPAAHLAVKSGNITHQEAAAATLAALTVWQAMTQHGHVQAGQKVLIHAAAGGVGHFAIQVAKHLGAYVIGTSSVANKDFIRQLGADEHIDYKSVRFEEAVTDVDFVLDTMGGDTIERSLDVVKPGGTIISIVSGWREQVAEKGKEKGINGYNMLVQSSGEDMKALAELLADEKIKAHVSQTFAFDKMVDAHLQIESGRTVGKIVVVV